MLKKNYTDLIYTDVKKKKKTFILFANRIWIYICFWKITNSFFCTIIEIKCEKHSGLVNQDWTFQKEK